MRITKKIYVLFQTEERQLTESTKQESDKLQKKVSELQNELKTEMRKAKMASDGSVSFSIQEFSTMSCNCSWRHFQSIQ